MTDDRPTAQAYDELQLAFDHYNQVLFDGDLPACLITLQRKNKACGYFSAQRFVHHSGSRSTDEIAMNPQFFASAPLIEVLQTLVHEMAHAWQYHRGKPGRRGYHNSEWAEKMEAIGLMPSSTGAPGGKRTGEHMSDYPIPGGPFLVATDKLLTSDFRISWADRFGMGGGGVDSVSEGGDGSEGATKPPRDRSNRVKYRCPCCGSQAWGKPGLRLLCGEAECEAAELEAAEC